MKQNKEMREQLKQAELAERDRKKLEHELHQQKCLAEAAENAKKIAERAKAEAIKNMARSSQEKTLFDKLMMLADDYVPLEKKQQEEKSEFNLEGIKIVLAKYEGMNMEGLLVHNAVDMRCREMIVKDQFFELRQLHRFQELSFSQHNIVPDMPSREACLLTVAVPMKAAGPSMHPELFQLLYEFGQFYLQVYLAKATAFLEYLAFITKYGIVFSVPVLVNLDNNIRRFYVQRPHLNWDVTRVEVQRMVKDAEIEMQDKYANTGASKSTTAANNPQQNSQTPRQGGGHSGSGANSGAANCKSSSGGCLWSSHCRDDRDNRCHNYNFR